MRASQNSAARSAVFLVLKHRLQPDDPQLLTGDEDWLLWQLADSVFPAGGFAHSSGLEAAWQHGEIRNRTELAGLLETSLWQFGHSSLPFFNLAHLEPPQLEAIDLRCDAFLSNHVANRASRLQGRAFLSSAEKIFPSVKISPPPCGHLAPVFGVATRSLGLKRNRGARLFLFLHLRGLVSAAIRLGIVGPMEGNALLHRFGPIARGILVQCNALAIEEVAQTAPLLEIWQGTQDRLYSRLFQS